MQRFFTKLTKKVVSSCLLQYKPVCVINFDKLCRKKAKKNKFSRLFSIAILRKSSSCVTSYQDALVSFAFYEDSIRRYLTRLCFNNLILRLSLCLFVFARMVVNIQHSIGCLVVFSWYDVITCIAKSKQFIGAHCALLDAFSAIFLSFDVPQYSDGLDYITDVRPAIYFNNQKIVAYHL